MRVIKVDDDEKLRDKESLSRTGAAESQLHVWITFRNEPMTVLGVDTGVTAGPDRTGPCSIFDFKSYWAVFVDS